MQRSIEGGASPGGASLDFLVGRDEGGHWLVVETHGLAGGFFNTADDALRFVASAFGGRPSRVQIVERVLEPFQRTCVEIADLTGAATSRARSLSRAA